MKNSLQIDSLVKRVLPLSLILLVPTLAQAHPGLPGHTHGFTNGVLHPLTGLDHICAMLAVGLWAAQRGGRAVWLVPATFVSVMIAGGMLGMGGVGIPYIEQGIAASVLVLGLLIAAAVRLPVAASMAVVGLFALFHGYAHGAEMPATASGLAYGLGFVLATIGLHLTGIGLGLAGQKIVSAQFVRCLGGAIAACGVFLCFVQ
ncbi:MAG TPA: HupE/UreJ family protein [Candidatus Paceibacterota bacterium]|nr:HupE/UreJ family protein [Candidatus Paceibacterota bacterium]